MTHTRWPPRATLPRNEKPPPPKGEWFATAGGKEDAIRALGLSPTRFYQLLVNLIASRAALEYDSVTVNRLRRVSTRGKGES